MIANKEKKKVMEDKSKKCCKPCHTKLHTD